jgi:intracellular multiplication protein IcmT
MADVETAADWHWRNSMKNVRFFMFDARLAIFFMLFILHMRLWTFCTFLFFCFFFWFLERRGLVFSAALRTFRTWILGKRRPAWLWIRKRKFRDYG